MKKLRVMLLVHVDLVPPEDLHGDSDPRMKTYQTEYDVQQALLALGHEVRVVGVYDDLAPIRQAIDEWKPHIAFNLLEEFAGNSAFDFYVVSYLGMMKVPYTGCHPRGLVLARDKALSKKILTYHRIRVPQFAVFPYGLKVRKSTVNKLHYPMIVKSLTEEGSIGIAQASFVNTPDELIARIEHMHQLTHGDVIAEQYIEGRELYVTVLGNQRLEVLPIRELVFDKVDADLPRMATYKVKWDDNYRERWGIDYIFARNLPHGTPNAIMHLCKRVYKILDLDGYARMDLRLSPDGHVYVLEANPNPGISSIDDVALSAERAGMKYPQLIQKIINLGLRARQV